MKDSTQEPIRVVLVDDHQLVRAGVRAALDDGVQVVGEAEDVESAIALIERVEPQVVLLDVHLPGGNGPAVLRGLPNTAARFLALSVSDAVEDVLAVIRAGARGYVTKAICAEDLNAAVRRVAAGDAVFSPRLAGFVLDAFAGQLEAPTLDPALEKLTAREQEVLRLLARGYAYKELAVRLSISVKTVESHASAVLRKLQLSNRRELSRWAAARHLV